MAYENVRLKKSKLTKLSSKHNEIPSLRTSGEQDEYNSTIDCDYAESNLTEAGTSTGQQGIAKTDSNTLGENVTAGTSQPTGEPDDIIGKTNNNSLKDRNNIKSSTKATVTIIFIVVIIAVGVASSAITVAIKDMNSLKQDNDQLNSGTKKEKQTDMLTPNLCNGSVLTLIANDTTAILMSHGYLFSHANNLSCSWLIDSGIDGQTVAISLDYYNINCSFGDSLFVYDGASPSDSRLVNSACGRNNVRQVYVSSDRYVIVTFTTESANQGQGFQLSYTNVPDTSLNLCDRSASKLSASNNPELLVSPGYPFSYANNLDCRWLIDSGIDGQSIAISLDYYNMNCSFRDSISMYDGSSTSDYTLVNHTCGKNTLRQVYISADRHVLVTFTTNSANQGQGFQLYYVRVPDKSLNHCGSSTLPLRASNTKQVLVSPGYPFSYANNLACRWLIDSGIDGQSTAISLDYYNMACSFGDSFSVFDGSSTSDITFVNSTCGEDNATQLYVSSARYVLVTFTTDSANQGQGFQLSYINIPDTSLNQCYRSTVPLSASYTTNTLISNGYPFTYAHNCLCSWLIDSHTDGNSIAISLDYYNMNCSFGDSFTVYDGSSTSNSTLVDSVCGKNNVRQVYLSSDRYVLVTFTTDGANQGQGFQLSYVRVTGTSLNHCASSTLLLRASNIQDILVSPGYPFSYSNNLACSWLIDSGIDGQFIAISLDYYNMDCSFGDSFSVYDGSSTSDLKLVNSACGRNKAKQMFVSSDRHVFVTFTTDGAKQGQGFQLTYVNILDESLKPCTGYALKLSASNKRDVLISPGYPFSYSNNVSCSWLIDSGIDGLPIAIYLEHYNMNCSLGDSFSVYNGSSTSDFALVNSGCGRNRATQLYVSSDRYVLVTFTADSVNQGHGFQLAYANVPDKSSYTCPLTQTSVIASETLGKITSPGYPYMTLLANYLSCTWLIDSGVDGQPIVYNIKICTVEFSYGHKLSLYDGSTTSKRLLFATCRQGYSGWHGPYVTTDRYALVSFETLSTNYGNGFQLTYISAADTSATGCNSTYTLTASTTIQYLTSEGFPSYYKSNSNCSWLISTERPSTISITVVWSQIRKYYSDCRNNHLKIYDGSSVNETTLMTKNCESYSDSDVTPTTYTSTSNNVLVVFVSDEYDRGRGFIIKYYVTD